jgi:hypothetical protein
LLSLADIERIKVKKNNSNLYEVMSDAVLRKAPFQKWLRDEDEWNVDKLKDMPGELRAVTGVCGHYVYYDEKVKEAINRLYNNLKERRLLKNPEAYVMKAVKKAVMRYVDAFNLRGSTLKILRRFAETKK